MGDLRRTLPAIQLQERQDSEHHPHLLNASAQHTFQLSPVAWAQSKRQRRTWHACQTPIHPSTSQH